MEGGNPFFLSTGDTDAEKDVAGSAFMAAPSLRDVAWWFSTLSVRCRVRALPCIHLSRAAVDTSVKCTLRSPGPSFGSHALPVVRPLRFRVLTLQFPSAVRQAAASLAPWYPRL